MEPVIGRTALAVVLGIVAAHGLAAFEPPCDPPLRAVATGHLKYQLIDSGEIEQSTLRVRVPREVDEDGAIPYYSQDSVREAAALGNFVIGLQMATQGYFAELIEYCESMAAEAQIECTDGMGVDCE